MGARMALFCAHVHDDAPADLNHPLEFGKGRGIDPILGIAESDAIPFNSASDLLTVFHGFLKHRLS